MYRLSTLPAVLLVLCACATGEPPPREVPLYSIGDFLGATNYRGASFSPSKDKVLYSSDETGIFNAYALALGGPASEPVALTRSTTESVFALSYFPSDERFLYTADRGGDERNHVYVRELDGSVTDVTPGEGLKASFIGWAHDDASFYVSTNERDPAYFDVWEIARDGYARQMIYENESGYDVHAISPDERWLALVKTHSTADSDIWLYDRTTRKMEHLTPHEGEVSNAPEAFTPDGASLYFTTDEGAEFKYLVRYDLASGERETVDKPEWDVVGANVSKNGKYLVVAVNRDASTEVRVYERETMRRVELPALPTGDVTSVTISRDEEAMLFYASSSTRPRDLYHHAIGSSEPPRRLTDSLPDAIDPENLVEAEVVRFASYDGVEVPGILYKPHVATPESKVPALVWVHGGPGGQSRTDYSGLVQYLVNHGYAVYAINNRGSSGYGKTFFSLDDRKHGESDLGDCVASKKMLADTGWVDPDRIGIIGGSYGGYMVLAAMAFEPDEFAAGVDIFGVANWVRTLENMPAWWGSQRDALYRELGHPVEDRKRLERISPVFHAGRIERPLMVLQGANDPRVLKVESDDMVAAARDNGARVEYLVFDDEGHGFRKKENQLRGYEAILAFLDTHLKNAEPAGGA
jgi:dipeptidyl aminopeptidase/acylaminoacyl peptidase